MFVKPLVTTSSRNFCKLLKVLVILVLIFTALHFYAQSFHPTYHKKIVKHLNSKVIQIMEQNNFNRIMNQLDSEPFELADPEYEKYIKLLGLTDPGEYGAGVELPSNASDEIKKMEREGYVRHGFNAFVSNMISLNRKVNDTRPEVCKNRVYTDLPKCTIIIPFHNEEWSLFLRTIHAIMNRSPDDLLEEVILVDDASDRDEMMEKLDIYLRRFPKVKIIRSPIRHGLIESRMIGVANAKAPVIFFLDSHVEVLYGWLEPVLDRFKYQQELLVTSFHRTLVKTTLENTMRHRYDPAHFGGFLWSLDFAFLKIEEYEKDNPLPMYDPKPVPTVFGSMHAIRKDYFIKIGLYDAGFDIWGGEDVELSFRVWCCGGKVEFVPCSQAAHMSKDHKYIWPKSEKGGYRWNTNRIAETWLDEYKEFYYKAIGNPKNRKYGDISDRLALKEKLNCKPFRWFYHNIYKNITVT